MTHKCASFLTHSARLGGLAMKGKGESAWVDGGCVHKGRIKALELSASMAIPWYFHQDGPVLSFSSVR